VVYAGMNWPFVAISLLVVVVVGVVLAWVVRDRRK
jgi:hypothetical protein